MKIKFLILNVFYIIFSMFSMKIFADQDILKKINLDEAVSIALENNFDYKIAALKQKEADKNVDAAWGQLVPVLESEVSATRQGAENGAMSMTDGQNDIRFIQLKFGINPGVFYNSLQMSREVRKIAVEDVRRTKAILENSVIKAYFGVLVADEVVKLRKDSLNVLSSNLTDLRNMYKTGSVPKYDVLQAEVKERSQEVSLLEAESELKTALDMFNSVLGADSIKYTPDSGILESGKFTQLKDDQGKIDSLIMLALKNRPEVLQLTDKREMMRYSKNISNSYYFWPTFSIAGSYGMTQYLPNEIDVGAPPAFGIDFSKISGTDEWQKTWQVRVGATYKWDTFIPKNRTGAAAGSDKLKQMEAEEELNKLRRNIGISIRSNYSGIVTSYQTITSQKQNIESATEGLRIARESFKAGALKNSDLLSAELSLTNARLGYISAINKYYISLAELKKETGSDDTSVILEENK